ncbi:MAG: hypothetical protein LKI24_17310 [Acidipropionibacterium sp.]|nr:hypothetical protein [Acidipropionibacterium sp.]
MVDFRSGPVLAAVVPGQNPLIAVTAARLSEALGHPFLHLAFVDTTRYTVEEFPDGTVRHAAIDPDAGRRGLADGALRSGGSGRQGP